MHPRQLCAGVDCAALQLGVRVAPQRRGPLHSPQQQQQLAVPLRAPQLHALTAKSQTAAAAAAAVPHLEWQRSALLRQVGVRQGQQPPPHAAGQGAAAVLLDLLPLPAGQHTPPHPQVQALRLRSQLPLPLLQLQQQPAACHLDEVLPLHCGCWQR